MPLFLEKPAHRWAYTFLRPHVEMMRDPEANPVRNRSILFRFFSELTFEDFFSGGSPGKPWFIDVTIKRSRAGQRDEYFRAHEIGRVIAGCEDPIALLSPPGSGKTTLQLFSFFNCLTPGQRLFDAGYVPCFVSGHALRESLEHQIRASVGMGGFTVDEVRRYLAQSRRLLFLFDLNRVPWHEQPLFAARITNELAGADTFRAQGNRLILAARNRPELANQLFGAGYELWSIQPLPRDQIRNFLEDTLEGASLSPGQWDMLQHLLVHHGELLRNPFHLSLITILLSRDPGSITEINSTGRLFKLVSEQILAQEFPAWDPLDNARPLRPRTGLETRVHPGDLLLQQVAACMAEGGVRSLDVDDTFPDLIESLYQLHNADPWWPRRGGRPLTGLELEPLLKEHTLFRISPEGSYALWLHDTFQDFYAAKWLAYDPKTGASRVRSLDGGADPAWIGLIEQYSQNPRWQELLPILMDLLEPKIFEHLVRGWALARFTRNDLGQLVPREDRPNRFVLRHVAGFLERLGWYDELERLVQPPFLRIKTQALGPLAVLPDLEARVRLLLERYRQRGGGEALLEAVIWLAIDRAAVREETEGGSILRDHFEGRSDLPTTRRRIELLDDQTYRFFHLLLLAESLVRRRADDPPHEPSPARIEQAEALLKEAFALPVSAVQLLHQQRDPWLQVDLVECQATIHTADVDPDLFERFFRKLDLGPKVINETLQLIAARGGLWRAVQLIQRLAPDPHERRHYKPVLKEVVARYAQQGLYSRALEAIAIAAGHQRDELIGMAVECAIANAQLDRARELIREIGTDQLREYLHAVLRGKRKLKKHHTQSFRDQLVHRWSLPDMPEKETAAATSPDLRSFFVKRRTDLLNGFYEDDALRHRPPGEVGRRRVTVFDTADRVSALARLGWWWWTERTADESERCFLRARDAAKDLPHDAISGFALFELYRHYRLTDREAEAGRVFAKIRDRVGEIRHADVDETANQLAEQFAWWGFIEPAMALMERQPRETWFTRGRFQAHYLRHSLAHDGPDAAFTWFDGNVATSRDKDKRHATWVNSVNALAAAWEALGNGDLTHCLQRLDEARAIINAFHTRRQLEPFMSYFRGQMLANLVLMCMHHESLRPIAEDEMRAMASPPMRAFCVGHYLRFAPDGRVPEDLVELALEALGRYDKAFFRGKVRVMKIYAEAIAELPEPAWRPWLGRWLEELSTDPRLLHYALPDVAWALTRFEPTRRRRVDMLDAVLDQAAEADVFG